MNQKRSREIREIMSYDPREKDPTVKRQYNRAKKQYNKLSKVAAKEFLDMLRDLYTNK
jgi:hypothetical protein